MSLDRDLYDRSGQPISFERWCLLFEDARYQVVRQLRLGTLFISTVWTGTDLGLDEQPMIFETMLFVDGVPVEMYRYSSEQAAIENHEKLERQARLLSRAIT